MLMINGFILALQLLLLLAAVPIAVLSYRTSLRRQSKQNGYMAMAVVMSCVAFLGALLTIVLSVALDDHLEVAELGIPASTIILCGLAIYRSTKADRKRAQSSRFRSSTNLPRT